MLGLAIVAPLIESEGVRCPTSIKYLKYINGDLQSIIRKPNALTSSIFLVFRAVIGLG